MKPRLPSSIWVLAPLAALGLVAQFLAAENAFSQTSTGWVHSVAAALLIEAAIVIDALILVGSGNKLAGIGLVIGLAVSGTYNYTQAATKSDLSGWQLYAQAIGPLAALTSIGLALGYELREYYAELANWEMDQITEADRAAAVNRQIEQRERQQRLALELKQDELDREFQRAEQKRHRLAEQRLERKRIEASLSRRPDSGRTDGRTSMDTSPVRWPDKATFLADVGDNPDILSELSGQHPDNLSGGDIVRLSGADISTKTGRRWLNAARELIGSNGHEGGGE